MYWLREGAVISLASYLVNNPKKYMINFVGYIGFSEYSDI